MKSYSLDNVILSISSTTLDILLREYVLFFNLLSSFLTSTNYFHHNQLVKLI